MEQHARTGSSAEPPLDREALRLAVVYGGTVTGLLVLILFLAWAAGVGGR